MEEYLPGIHKTLGLISNTVLGARNQRDLLLTIATLTCLHLQPLPTLEPHGYDTDDGTTLSVPTQRGQRELCKEPGLEPAHGRMGQCRKGN